MFLKQLGRTRLSLTDLLSSAHTSPSLGLLSTESLHFQPHPLHNISITSQQCMRSEAIDKEETYQSLKEIVVVNAAQIFQNYAKRMVLNEWLKRIKGNKYLKDQLQNMITGVVRLGIILERKRRFGMHKSFLEVKKSEEKHIKQLQQKVVETQVSIQDQIQQNHQNALETVGSGSPNRWQDRNEHQLLQNLCGIITCYLNKQGFLGMSQGFERILNKCERGKEKEKGIMQFVEMGDRMVKDREVESMDRMKVKSQEIEKMEILVRSITFVHKVLRGYFYLNAWNSIKKVEKGFIKKKELPYRKKPDFVEEFRTFLNISPQISGLEEMVPDSNDRRIDHQQVNQYIPSNPLSLGPSQAPALFDINEDLIDLQYSTPKTIINLPSNIQADIVIQSHNDVNQQQHIQPILKKIHQLPSLSSIPSHHKLSPKYSTKSSASQKSQTTNKKPTLKLKSPNPHSLKTHVSPSALLPKQIPIVNQYYITNNEYIPTYKRSVRSPVNYVKPPSSPTSTLKPKTSAPKMSSLTGFRSPKKLKF